VDGEDGDPDAAAPAREVHFVHTDHLGGSAVLTSASGTVVRRISYGVFGEIRSNVIPLGAPATALDPREKFTGQRYDAATALYYYGARYYDPALDRFIQADSVVADPTDPQSLNRYAYVRNDPLSAMDPTGNTSMYPDYIGPDYAGVPNYYDYDYPDALPQSDFGGFLGGLTHSGGADTLWSDDWLADPFLYDSPSMYGSSGGGYTSGYKSMQEIFNVPGYPQSQSEQSALLGAAAFGGGLSPAGLSPLIPGQPEINQATQIGAMGLAATGTVAGSARIGAAAAPYLAAGAAAAARGARSIWKNLSFDGPSPGAYYLNGRIAGVRWKESQFGLRLDIHPLPGSGGRPVLHINYGPLAKGESNHLVLFDPNWLKRE
jgi:RHS repeat-associated protein